MWYDNFNQLKEELVDLIAREVSTAIDSKGQSVEPYKVSLAFLAATIRQVKAWQYPVLRDDAFP